MTNVLNKEKKLLSLVESEKWTAEPVKDLDEMKKLGSRYRILTPMGEFGLKHPYLIYLQLYRDELDAASKFQWMKKVHDYLWPGYVKTWNKWEELRFTAHCDGYEHIILAGGKESAKSLTCAKIALIFWLSRPRENAVIVASTTLQSLQSRIWGYVADLAHTSALALPLRVLQGQSPKILHPQAMGLVHGIFALAIQRGEDVKVLSTLIGRHPKHGMMLVLDEATEMNPAITKAIPNLETEKLDLSEVEGLADLELSPGEFPREKFFQLLAAGNSCSRNDLHGALSTPAVGWDKIDPMRDFAWKTTHKNGICLYSNPYDSPAINDPDPVKRIHLSRFFITKKGIEEKKRLYGEESESFYRFVLGYWRKESIDDTLVTERFITEQQAFAVTEWSGFYPLHQVAGLDVNMQVGSKGCVLRFATLGQNSNGLVVLDYGKEENIYYVDVKALADRSGELQIAEQVVHQLRARGMTMRQLAVDCTGAGRAMTDLIKFVSGEPDMPYRIQSVNIGTRRTGGMSNKKQYTDPSLTVVSPNEMWAELKEFFINKQIKGLDVLTASQFCNRLIETTPQGKRVLEKKSDYVARMSAINPKLAFSPDEADASVLALQVAIMQFGFRPGQRWDLKVSSEGIIWKEKEEAIEKQRLEQLKNAASGFSSARAPLLPNFSGALEDTVRKDFSH